MNKKKKLTTKETFDIAVQNHQKNNLQVAENLYREILKTNPDHFESIFGLGTLLGQTKRFDLAKPLLQKAIQIQPNYATAHSNLGNIQRELAEHQEAISSYEKAIQINPNYADAHYNLGLVLHELGEYQKAINCYEKAIQINPNYTDVYNNLGIALQELGEYQKAINCYEKVIRINPRKVEVYNNLGITFKELGEYQKAINCYEKAIEIDPNNISITNGLSDLFKLIQVDNVTKNNSASLKELFLFLFRKNNINHTDIFNNAKLMLFIGKNDNQIEQIVSSDSLLLKNKVIQNLSSEELFLLMLQKSLMTDKFLEELLTKLRCEILFTLVDSNQNILKGYFDFIVSLAEQCLLNEYVYAQCKKETNCQED